MLSLKFNEAFKRIKHLQALSEVKKNSMNRSSFDFWQNICPHQTDSSMINAAAVDMKWTNESSSIQTKKEKHHSEAFGITGIPESLRYSPDSSNTFMHKQRQVSGAALSPASVRLGSLRTSGLALQGVWAATGNTPGTRLLLKQMLASMNCGISTVLDFASHFSVSQPCQEWLGNRV